jgi:Homeodomain-like domain
MEKCNCDLERRCDMCNAHERSKILDLTLSKRLSRKDAAKHLDLSSRQLRRILNRYKEYGLPGLISNKKDVVGRIGYSVEFKQKVIDLYASKYPDFGPTFAAEKMLELDGIKLSSETLRHWLTAAGKWVVGRTKEPTCHPPRARRDCIGELIQMDGSPHAWFEERGPKCTLLLAVDDATSKIMAAKFVKSENTDDYFMFVKDYMLEHGKPVSFYIDKHCVFKVNAKEARSGDGLTHFSRALQKFKVELIFANSAPAKGRVERANGVTQDRLVKELRLLGISTIGAGNEYLRTVYKNKHNDKFAKDPAKSIDMHTPLSQYESDNINLWLTKQFKKKVTKNMTVQHNNIMYFIKTAHKLSVRRIGVILVERLNGHVDFLYKGKPIDHKVLGRKNKKMGLVLNRTEANDVVNKIIFMKTEHDSEHSANIQR